MVEEVTLTCVTQYYQDDKGRWWWHCFTHNDGSNKYQRHRRGHKRDTDAAYGAKQHSRDMNKNQLRAARSKDSHDRMYSATNEDDFRIAFLEIFHDFHTYPNYDWEQLRIYMQKDIK